MSWKFEDKDRGCLVAGVCMKCKVRLWQLCANCHYHAPINMPRFLRRQTYEQSCIIAQHSHQPCTWTRKACSCISNICVLLDLDFITILRPQLSTGSKYHFAINTGDFLPLLSRWYFCKRCQSRTFSKINKISTRSGPGSYFISPSITQIQLICQLKQTSCGCQLIGFV